MNARAKAFLVRFAFCLLPLLILTIIYHWQQFRVVDSTVNADAQRSLSALSGSLDHRLSETEIALQRFATSAPLREFIKSSEVENESPAREQNAFGFGLPGPLYLDLVVLLKGREHFTSLALFDRKRQPLFKLERQPNGAGGDLLMFHKSGFQPPHSVDVAPNQPVANVVTGSVLQFTVRLTGDNQANETGLLVGELRLDEVIDDLTLSREAQETESAATSLVIATDNQLRVVYLSNKSTDGQPVNSVLPEFVPIATAAAANRSGLDHLKTADGSVYATAFSPLPRWHFSLATARSRTAALTTVHQWGMIGLGLSIGLALIGAVIFGKIFPKRSRGIQRVTEDLSAIVKGELDRRIELKSGDDARGIADRINVVTERLRAQIAREEESRQFESFVRLSAMLTHDLKNAIEALSLIVGNMERHFDNEQFRADALKSLTGATDKLKGIVARLSRPLTSLSGEHKRPTDVDLVPILKRVVAITAEPQNQKHTIDLRLPNELYALVDATQIEEVIENLVLNALEAMSEPGGTLTVEAGQSANGAVVFSISDTGSGMTQSFVHNRLFRPFSTTKKTGVGLGLYTCREVVQANAGSIDVQSIEGLGTTFRVVLPSTATEKRS
jgi:signal transduction histidine kinase